MDILTPIFICVVLPVAIVWLVIRTKQNETNKTAESIIKAIESGNPIDQDFFKTQPLRKGTKERLLGILTAACILIALGVGLLLIGIIIIPALGYTFKTAPSAYMLLTFAGGILSVVGASLIAVYFIMRKVLAKEIAAEEKAIGERKRQ